jgi:hypothetical protein
MAVLPNGQPTLLDAAALTTDSGAAVSVAEVLHQTNPGFDDIPMAEANSTTGHKVTARQKLPESYLRRINQGIKPSKSGYGSILEAPGLFNALGQVDAKLVELAVDKARFRFMENKGHIESLGQRFFQSLFYGDPNVIPEDFMGIAPRYASLAASDRTAVQIIDAGGTGADLTSIYLVGWGEGSVMGFYPKGTQAGIKHTPLPQAMIDDGAGGKYLGYEDWFDLNAGLAVQDYRNIVRIANIDVSDLQAGTPHGGISAGANLVNLMTVALEQLNNPDGLNPVFYAPRVISTYLRLQIQNKANVWLTTKEVAGKSVTAFDNFTVRRTDAIALNETRVIA